MRPDFDMGLPPFCSNTLKSIKTQAEARSIRLFNFSPDIFPGWGKGGPAPIFISNSEVFLCEILSH